MLTPADHKRLRYQARSMIGHHLTTLVANGLSGESAETYATGIAEGVRDFLSAYLSDETAYNVLTQVADKAEGPLLRAARDEGK